MMGETWDRAHPDSLRRTLRSIARTFSAITNGSRMNGYNLTVVDHTFGELRARIPAATNLQAAILVSPHELYAKIADMHSAEQPPAWFDAATLAQTLQNRTTAVVTPGASLDAARAYVDDATLAFLRARVGEGKIVLAWDEVARELDVPRQSWSAGWKQIPEAGGILYSVSAEGAPR
jgi:hypothetical protein